MCSRLVKQKGFDIILASGALNALDAQFVFLGAGEERYKAALRQIAARRPQHVSAEFTFTDKVEHRLIAGSDLLLMPSEYEPCGLTQMRAQRYGALVIGRRVGGISRHGSRRRHRVSCSTHSRRTPSIRPIGRALQRYYDKQAWRPRMYEAMGRDFGWDSSASALRSAVSPRARRRQSRELSRRHGFRPRTSQPPSVRAESRSLAARQRLDHGSGGGYLSASDRLTSSARRRGNRRAGDGRHHADPREPAGESGLRERAAPVLQAATRGVRRSGSGDARHRTTRISIPVVRYWRERLDAPLRAIRFARRKHPRRVQGARQDDGRLELITSAATHGFLPLLGRDESIRFQLAVGQAEHERLFGQARRGTLDAGVRVSPGRTVAAAADCSRVPAIAMGSRRFLSRAGVRFVFVDAHLAGAGRPLGVYGELPTSPNEMVQQRGKMRASRDSALALSSVLDWRSTDRRLAPRALIRDPRSSMQVWSRHGGYPGDGAYLEFHKIRYPGGLKLWRVTSETAGLGDKLAYEPELASAQVLRHAKHFARLLGRVGAYGADAGRRADRGAVRHRAVRALVVRGRGLRRGALSRDRSAGRSSSAHGVVAPGQRPRPTTRCD